MSTGSSAVNKQSLNVTWGCGGTWGKGWVMSYNVKRHGAVWVVARTFPPTSFICSVTRFLISLSSCLAQLPCHRHLQFLRSVRQQRALSNVSPSTQPLSGLIPEKGFPRSPRDGRRLSFPRVPVLPGRQQDHLRERL